MLLFLLKSMCQKPDTVAFNPSTQEAVQVDLCESVASQSYTVRFCLKINKQIKTKPRETTGFVRPNTKET